MRIAMANGHEQRVINAIHRLRDRFADPVGIEELAAVAKISSSAFHRQFKALTSTTPLQYQKQLRLLETRRLMVADAANVETAAFEVGYEVHRNSAVNTAECSGCLRDATSRHSGALLPDIARGADYFVCASFQATESVLPPACVRARTPPKSGPRPSAIVGCVNTASRSMV
jgi:AraC-like DNA-binding protein